MKLSIYAVMESLAAFKLKTYITNGEATIEGVRVFSDTDMPIDAHSIYIGAASDFWASYSNAVILAHGQDFVIVENSACADLINILFKTFEYYNIWEHRLREAQFSDDPYQKILDIAHEVFQCPMLLGCKNLQIYAITDQYTDEEVYEGWNEVKRIKTMPVWLINNLYSLNIADWVSDDVEVAIIPPWPSMKSKFQIRANCHLNGTLWGHLMVYPECDKPHFAQMARTVADVYSSLLCKIFKSIPEKYTTYLWLADFLDGKKFEDDVFRTLYWRLNWKETEYLRLFRISSQTDKPDQNLFFWLFENVKLHAPNAIVFTYHDSIVVVTNNSENQRKAAKDNIKQILRMTEYHCGVSFQFQGLRNLGTYYKQAGYAIAYAGEAESKIHYFEECQFSGLMEEISTLSDYMGWVSPNFSILMDYDVQHNTELYKTFISFLENDCHIGNTGKKLFIHRNTVINRIEKISQIINVNFGNPDEVLYYKICMHLIKKYRPDGYDSIYKLRSGTDSDSNATHQWKPNMY